MKLILFLTLLLAASGARANLLGSVITPSGALEIFSTQKLCLRDAFDASWNLPGGATIPGCWKRVDDSIIQVIFLDGDAIRLPVEVLKRPTVL